MLSFSLDLVTVLQLVAGTLLPLLVAVVTKVTTHPGRKAIALAALALVASVLGQIIDALVTQTPLDVGLALLLAIPTFVVAVATHYGLWKPTGVAETVQESVGRTD